MLLYNTTYHVEQDTVEIFLIWLKEKYIPEVNNKGFFTGQRLYKVLSHIEDGMESYCLQWDIESSGLLHKWYASQGSGLNEELNKTFSGKVLAIPTLMEVLE